MKQSSATRSPRGSLVVPRADARVSRSNTNRERTQQFREDVLSGLRNQPKRLRSIYFYDDRGSELFEAITRLPEYYLTRTERAILDQHAGPILELVMDAPTCIVDLGAGDGSKTRILLERMHELGGDVRYAPIDVSASALWGTEQQMRRALPWLTVDPVHEEYAAGLAQVRAQHPDHKLLVLWLGSSIGNFEDQQAVWLLRRLASECLPQDTLLIGFDLLKDPRRLLAAYDDSQGVTAEFNFNLLARMNRELSADFDRDAFVHHATFAPDRSAVESYLISTQRQVVTVAGERFGLDAWEPIQTEVSCKYSEAKIEALLSAAGLVSVATFSDADGDFADVACRPRHGAMDAAV